MSKGPSTGAALRRAAPALVICLLGTGMRLWLAWNFPAGVDLASYDSVVAILRAGRPLYESTHLYNYSPLWSWALLGLRNAAEDLGIAPESLIRIFLTIGDIACAALLFRLARRRGAASPWTVSALFLGNPVLIWIGAAQGQFDVLVVSFLLFAILATPEEPQTGRHVAGEWIPMLLLGVSMAWKQVTVFHPLLWRNRVRRPLLLVAYAVPAAAFLPYARQWRAIARNVLFYRSVPASYGFSELVLFDRRWAAPVAAAALAGAAACALTGAGRDLARGSLRIFLVLLLLAPGIGGQYLFWPLALGCLVPSPGFWMTTAAASLWILGGRLSIEGTARFGGHLVWLAIAFWLVRELAAAGIWPRRADPANCGPDGPSRDPPRAIRRTRRSIPVTRDDGRPAGVPDRIPGHVSDSGSPRRWRALILISIADLLAMSLWFGASAAAPAIGAEWRLGGSGAAPLTVAVQLGFVLGTLASALANAADLVPARLLLACSALAGALVNAAFALFARSLASGLPLRVATGFCLAGVYPPAMKLLASWFDRGRGMALGVLIGALTVGKASPYLVNALGSGSWRVNVLFVSALAAAGGLIVLLFVGDGPLALPRGSFDPRQAGIVFRVRSVRLASFGYFGHMWELYAMWTFAPVMIRASLAHSGSPPALAEASSFLAIGAGAAGCVLAGVAADRRGRTLVTSAALAVSGTCCAGIGLLFGGPPWALVAAATVWGAAVVADSAQFSACVTELADPRYVGTALTIQTCLGFLLTMGSIELVPLLVRAVGWRWAFAGLAPGPVFGIWSMLRLRTLPEASAIAQGRR